MFSSVGERTHYVGSVIIQVNQEPRHTEKSLKNLVPEKDMDRMMFVDEGYEGKEPVWRFPKGSKRGQ